MSFADKLRRLDDYVSLLNKIAILDKITCAANKGLFCVSFDEEPGLRKYLTSLGFVKYSCFNNRICIKWKKWDSVSHCVNQPNEAENIQKLAWINFIKQKCTHVAAEWTGVSLSLGIEKRIYYNILIDFLKDSGLGYKYEYSILKLSWE